MDFSQYGEPVDLSSLGEPVSEEISAKGNLGESASRAGKDIMQAVDMIASLPGFALKVGERGMYTLFAALEGQKNPVEFANKIAEQAYSEGWRKWSMTPLESTLKSLGADADTTGTITREAFDDFGKAVETGAEKVTKATGSTEAGEIGKQILDIGMLGLGTAAFRAAKPKEPKLSTVLDEVDKAAEQWKPKEEPFYHQDPADLFPETLETPYGTRTGDSATGWTLDENGIPVNRAVTDELQRIEAAPATEGMSAGLSQEAPLGVYERVPEQGPFTPKQDFELEPRPAIQEPQMDLPWEKVDPNALKTRQEDFDWTPTEEIDYRKFATPEQGIEHIQQIPTDITSPKGEIPYQEGLGLNASGESAASLEAINRLRQEQSKGIERYKINPETGQLTPLITADRVDARAAKGEAIIQVQDGKTTVLENNSRMSDQAVQGRSNYVVAQEAKLGNKGFGKKQGGSWTPFASSKEPKVSEPSKFGENAKAAVENVDKVLGAISTRLGNIEPRLKQHLVDFEISNSTKSGNRLDRVDTFLNDIYSNFPLKEDQATVKSLLLRNDFNTLEKVSPPKFKGEMAELRNVLNETGDDLVKYGIIEGKRPDYFPRMVVDYPGLLKAMGLEDARGLQKIIRDKEAKGGPLSEVELSDTVNKYMMGTFRNAGKPGFARGRKLDQIPPEFEKFYAEPAEALHSYLRSATFQIERAKFFGKNAAKNGDTGRFDLEQSIGNLIVELENKKNITPAQAEEVASMIRSRFGPGQRQSSGGAQLYKDATHFATLGDISNTLMQGADLFVVGAVDGFRPTLIGVAKSLSKEGIHAKDFGLMNRLSDDFVSDKLSTKVVNKTFKYSGLAKLDEAVKDVILNAFYEVGRKEAIKGKPKSTLYSEYKTRFGEEFPQLVEDLKAGKRTALTDRFVLSELANRQPIFKSEYSQAYLDNPNTVRPAMVLTSFMLKSADFMRTRAINQIKQGNKAQGIANLAKIGVGLALGNVSMDAIRNYLANKPVDEVDAKKIAFAMSSIFRFNEYFSQDLQEGAWGKAAGGLIAPPLRTTMDAIGSDLAPLWNEDKEFKGKSIKLIPFVGDELYGWSDFGEEARRKAERRMERED